MSICSQANRSVLDEMIEGWKPGYMKLHTYMKLHEEEESEESRRDRKSHFLYLA